jgi:cell fate regulator YaaT (PSP1 superfamily)
MAKPSIRLKPGELYFLDGSENTDIPFGLTGQNWVVFEHNNLQDMRPVHLVPEAVYQQYIDKSPVLPTVKLIRVATSDDVINFETKTQLESDAFRFCLAEIQHLGLPMKLIESHYDLNKTHLSFYYSADVRVDFRALLKILTQHFKHTRIQLTQVNVREEAKMRQGVGPCGKELCCATFLKEFAPINIKLARDQDILLGANKLAGMCGRLKCCLAYEVDRYRASKNQLPSAGQKVRFSPDTITIIEATVLEVQAAHDKILVETQHGKLQTLQLGQFTPL